MTGVPMEVVLGFDAPDHLAELAGRLEAALGLSLYGYTGLDGPWFSNARPRPLSREEAAAGRPRAAEPPSEPLFHLELNDPEPGYLAPSHPGLGRFLLRVVAHESRLKDIEAALRAAQLPFRKQVLGPWHAQR